MRIGRMRGLTVDRISLRKGTVDEKATVCGGHIRP